MPTVLVTGAAGFIGRYLCERLLTRAGLRVVGLARREIPDGRGLVWRRADLLDSAAITAVVRDVRPDLVVHLAGFASPSRARERPEECRADNLAATENLYAALAGTSVERVLFGGTGHIYAPAESVTESTPVRPVGPYSESKAAADELSRDAGTRFGLAVVRARLFNVVGPGQETGFAVPDWASQIAAAERRGEPLTLTPKGSLADRKDLTDVRDVSRALDLLLTHGQAGEVYNVATGKSWMMGDVLARLAALARVRVNWPPVASPGPPVTVDPSKLRAATGWQPERDLDQSLADVLNDWRAATVAV